MRTLTSIVSYPERGEGGNNRYRGNCSPKLVEDLIGFFKPHEICDYMCGSGTTKAAADSCGSGSHLYDLHSGFDLMSCEIPERPEFIFWHPPYWDIVLYSDVMYKAADVENKYGFDPRLADLSRIKDWDRFVAAQHNCFSDRTQYSGSFIPILHEYVMIVRKDAALMIPILTTKKVEVDIRDMRGATWRDIVAAVFEEHSGTLSLEEIYALVEGHKRAQESKFWRDKIRQTLRVYPRVFEQAEDGKWRLKKSPQRRTA